MTRALVLLAVLAACPAPQNPGEVKASDAIVKVTSNVRDAQVFVDGRYVAPLSALRAGVAVEPGVHRFELRRDEYFSSYLELKLGRAERKQVAMDLAPVLP